MPDNFLNPYHFIPLAAGQSPATVPFRKNEEKWPEHLTRDRFADAAKAHCGRLICRLEVEAPLLIANEQVDNETGPRKGWTKLLKPFELEPGEPAIPASALRGLLSSLAEAASHSALRVLQDKKYSQAASVFDFFTTTDSAPNPDLVPLHPGRDRLTLAEQLFGVTEHRDKEQQDHAAFALAGRVFPSFGRLHSAPKDGPYQPVDELLNEEQKEALKTLTRSDPKKTDYPLRNLASPKPPSPALYFTPAAGPGYIPKGGLKPGKYRPQGRKMYLHQPNTTPSQAFVHAGNVQAAAKDLKKADGIAKQHATPQKLVRPETVFYFHLDFENLSDLELQLLCYVLRPAGEFRHLLGHGKPLGLGRVKITPEGLFLIDRKRRYQTGLLENRRYHRAWSLDQDGKPAAQAWPDDYQREKTDLQGAEPADSPDVLRERFREWAGSVTGLPASLHALELLGNPEAVEQTGVDVHYPQVIERNGPDLETESFRWFVANDRYHQKFLQPIESDDTSPPTLPRLSRNKPDGGNPSGGQGGGRPRPAAPGGPPESRQPEPRNTPAPPPQDPRLAGKEVLRGKERDFLLAEIKANGKYRFEITTDGKPCSGYLQSQADIRKLRQEGIEKGGMVRLKILNFNAGTFQLAIPEQRFQTV